MLVVVKRLGFGVLFLASLNASICLAENQTIALRQGWNLVSLQVQPSPADLETVLAPILDQLVEVWTYNSLSLPATWEGYATNGSVTTLSQVNGGRAYWLLVVHCS